MLADSPDDEGDPQAQRLERMKDEFLALPPSSHRPTS
jgi:hypothetical protein